MNKLCEHNLQARELAGALVCPDFIPDRDSGFDGGV
tara:strand:- start:113 stop:220 length:108 start_codon:yes stop_codon:yes gene_type:complete